MLEGFPKKLLDNILCMQDRGNLHIDRVVVGGDRTVFHGTVRCVQCGSSYEIKNGILDMLSSKRPKNDTNYYEMAVRDREAGTVSEEWERGYAIANAMEIPSTLNKLGGFEQISESDILELGGGTGRYTKFLAQKPRFVLAVDFSWQSLVMNSRACAGANNVGLVCADIPQLKIQSESFDLALSTCYSNLPTQDIRRSSTKIVAEALKKEGRYVLSAHHHHPLEIFKNIPAIRRYNNGIFYHCFTAKTLKKEMYEYFSKIKTNTVCIWVPRISRIKKTRVLVSRISERIPLLNRLGYILLATGIKGYIIFLFMKKRIDNDCFFDFFCDCFIL